MNLEQEKQLLNKIREDDSKFSLIFKEYNSDIYRYCYSFVNSKEKAEDLCSEVFLTAYKKIGDFQDKGVSIKYWLIGIARNLAYKSFAKKELLNSGDEIEEIPDISSQHKFANEDLARDINKLLKKLPDTTREIIVLKIWEEYKFEEIAQITGMSLSSTKMQFYRGIEKLKDEMDSYSESDKKYPILFASISVAGNSVTPDLTFISNIIESFTQQGSVIFKIFNYTAMTLKTKALIAFAAIVTIAAISGAGYFIYDKYAEKDEATPVVTENREKEKPTEEPEVPADDNDTTTGGDTETPVAGDPDEGKIVYRYEYKGNKYKLTLDNPNNLPYEIKEDPQYGPKIVVDLDSSEASLEIMQRTGLSGDKGGLGVAGLQVEGDLHRAIYFGYFYTTKPRDCDTGPEYPQMLSNCYPHLFHDKNDGALYGSVTLPTPTGQYSRDDVSGDTLRIADALMKTYKVTAE